MQVDGAKLFDVDASSQIGIIAQRLSGMGGMHVLAKVKFFALKTSKLACYASLSLSLSLLFR